MNTLINETIQENTDQNTIQNLNISSLLVRLHKLEQQVKELERQLKDAKLSK